MTTYRSRAHVSHLERLVDALLGIAGGATLAVLLWLLGVWLRFH
jgi:hypothetical protein